MARCYIRNGVWAWPVAKQEWVLNGALDRDLLYQDILPADRAKAPGRVSPDWLSERARMLRPSGRPADEIHVASPLVLAVSEADLVMVLAAAVARNTTFVVHDTIERIPPCVEAGAVAFAVKMWQDAKALARTEPGRLEGVRVAAEKKRARTALAVRQARPLWRSRERDRMTTDQIAEQVGLSAKTLYAELGRRPATKKGRTNVET